MFNRGYSLFYSYPFYYLVCKLIPLKSYLTLIITAFIVLITSCSDMEKSSFEDKPLAVKKETKVVKAKKKKQKIKTATAGNAKTETAPAKDEEEEEEATASPENT